MVVLELSILNDLLKTALEQKSTCRQPSGLIDIKNHQVAIFAKHFDRSFPIFICHKVRWLQ